MVLFFEDLSSSLYFCKKGGGCKKGMMKERDKKEGRERGSQFKNVFARSVGEKGRTETLEDDSFAGRGRD